MHLSDESPALSGNKEAPAAGTTAVVQEEILAKPTVQSGERVLLNFGAVGWELSVYVNRQQAGRIPAGIPQSCLDTCRPADSSGNNELVVKVSNPLEKGIGPRGKAKPSFPRAIWYTRQRSGILANGLQFWKPCLRVHIKGIGITPDVDRLKP